MRHQTLFHAKPVCIIRLSASSTVLGLMLPSVTFALPNLFGTFCLPFVLYIALFFSVLYTFQKPSLVTLPILTDKVEKLQHFLAYLRYSRKFSLRGIDIIV
ncbi:hypothetical protein PHET_11948 [Paragonimus heterotremus]|uniref:Uncharacterized protein n=1 Tax=Paragonimus heterotremus TaxID=100268 RepID=A0A8J4T5V1_9TREM|nr:hypothetical protein PHET_11948 [Paragonimus heterotremus]